MHRGIQLPDTLNAPLTVTFSVGGSGIVNVSPLQATIAAGGSFTQASLSSPSGAGGYTLTVSAPGFTQVSFPVTVN